MSRVKRGTIKHAKRERLLRRTKGFMWRRKSTKRAAKQAMLKAWAYSTRDRKRRKIDFRSLWQVQINAASRQHGMPYGAFMNALRKKNIALDRKVLAELARQHPDVFKAVVEEAKK